MNAKGLPSIGLPSDIQTAGSRARVFTRVNYRQQIRLGHAGGCPDVPIHLITTIDSSGSVVNGKDCIGHRFLELQVAIEQVAKRCTCGLELVSILHFDHPVRNELFAVTLTNQHDIQSALTMPYDGGGCSLLGPSLAIAAQLARNHPDHRNVLVALSDFQLFDPPHVWKDFAAFPGEVHACVLGGGYVDFSGADVTVTNIEHSNPPGEAPQVLGRSYTGCGSRLKAA